MHTEIIQFLHRARTASGLTSMAGRSVVELGSYDLNGTPRPVFDGAASWLGVDWRPGPGVDVVGLAHEAPLPSTADVVVCCQMLEHDPHWRLTVARACRLMPSTGGWMFFTWAGPGYVEHELDTAPDDGTGEAYYGNLSTLDVVRVVTETLRDVEDVVVHTEYGRGTLDALMWVRVGRPG